MFHLAALALLLLPIGPVSQDGGARRIAELPSAPVRGRLVDVISGKPVEAFRFDVGAGDLHAACETDSEGRFATEAAFSAGTLELRSLENWRSVESPLLGRAREVKWDGVGSIEVFMRGGERFELVLEAGEAWPVAGDENGGWTVRLATEAQLAKPWRVSKGYADVREPLVAGGARWVRFGAFLDPGWGSADWLAKLYEGRSELIALSGDGLGYGQGAFDPEVGSVRVVFEERAALEVSIHERFPPLLQSESEAETQELLSRGDWGKLPLVDFLQVSRIAGDSPFGNAGLRLTRLDGAAESPALIWDFMPVGGRYLVGALEPGRWRATTLSENFPVASVDVQVAPGEVAPVELVLGARRVLGDIRVIVSDHDGDLVTENGLPVGRGGPFEGDPSSSKPQEPEVDVSVEQLDGPYRESAPSWAMCGDGIDVWCKAVLEGGTGPTFRRAVFPGLREGSYRVEVSALGRRVAPASRIVNMGEEVHVTLELPDGGPGYYLRLVPERQRYETRSATLRLVAGEPGSWDGFLEGGVATGGVDEIFLGADLPRSMPLATEWWLQVGWERRIYGDLRGFVREGDRFVKEIECPAGKSARIVCRDEAGQPLAGVRITLHGKEYVTDEAGRAVVESSKNPAAGDLAFPGYERVDTVSDMILFFVAEPDFEVVLRRSVPSQAQK